jgi:hypothetical protein
VGAEELAAESGGVAEAGDAEAGWWRVVTEPAVVAILLATVAHVARRNVSDIVLFLGIAGVIAADRVGAFRESSRLDLPVPRTRVLLAVAFGYGLLVLPLVRGGALLRLVLAAPGVVALLVLLRGRAGARPAPPPGRGWAVWPALLVFGCLFELANFLAQPDGTTPNHAHPVLSDIVEPWLASGPARAVFCAAWLFIGWRLLHVLLGASTAEEGDAS